MTKGSTQVGPINSYQSIPVELFRANQISWKSLEQYDSIVNAKHSFFIVILFN